MHIFVAKSMDEVREELDREEKALNIVADNDDDTTDTSPTTFLCRALKIEQEQCVRTVPF